MYQPALGAAAAILVALPSYPVSPPAPSDQVLSAQATAHEERPRGAHDGTMRPPVEPTVAPDLPLLEPACTTLSETPGDRAAVHWIEYLKFMSSGTSPDDSCGLVQ